jgi:prophage regulatory protein
MQNDQTPITSTPGTALLRLPEVIARVRKSKSALYADIAAGRFPQSVRLGHRTAVWVEAEIEAWIRERIQERSGPK